MNTFTSPTPTTLQRTVTPRFGPTPNQATTRGVNEQIELGSMLHLYTQFDSDSRSQLPSIFDLKPKMGDLNVVLTTKVYPDVKFCPVKGKSPAFPGFDKPDLREGNKCPLAFTVMDGMGLWSTSTSLQMRTQWWISLREAVRKGINRNRNTTSHKIKTKMMSCIKLEKAVTSLPNPDKPGNFRGYPSWSLYCRSGMKELADMAKAGTLHNLRVEGNHKAFFAFAHFILVETRPARAWKEVRRSKKVSEFFTVYDEALAMIILENGIAHWETLLQEEESGVEMIDGRKRKHCETLYSSKNGKGKGWNKAGMKRFGQYVDILEKQRKEIFSKSMEEALMGDYVVQYHGDSIVENDASLDTQVEADDFDEVVASGLKVTAV